MRCSYYCNGYCFWNGDRGEVCDKIQFGTWKRIKDGYCLMEESNRELDKYAEVIIADVRKREAQRVKEMVREIEEYVQSFVSTERKRQERQIAD